MKLKAGDIFSVIVGDKGFCLGQIVKIPNKESLSVVIYEELFHGLASDVLEQTVKACTPLLFGNTFDAKFYHRHWEIIGNNTILLDGIKLPYYKVGRFPVCVEDFDEQKIRRESEKEKVLLVFRKYVAPVRLENALLAHHGLGEWKDELYEPLLYAYNIKSNALINANRF